MMSYNVSQVGGQFYIAEEVKADALSALKTGYHGTYYHFEKCRYLEDALEEMDFDVETDDALNVTGVTYQRESYGDLEVALPFIRPQVRAGSYLEFQGEGGARWRILFEEGQLRKVHGRVVWE